MWLKIAAILCLMGSVELRPQRVDNAFEETTKHTASETIDSNDSALLDNRYSGSRTLNRVNSRALSIDFAKPLNVPYRYSNASIYNPTSPFISTVANHDPRPISRDTNATSRRLPNNAMVLLNKQVKSHLLGVMVGKIIRGLSFAPASNRSDELRSSNVLKLNFQPRNHVDLPEHSKLNSNVVQFWDTIPTGNPMNLRKQLGRNHYDIKKFTFGNRTASIITLSKENKSKGHGAKRQGGSTPLNLKNWPDGGLKDPQDLDRYEKYTALRLEKRNETEKYRPVVRNKLKIQKLPSPNKNGQVSKWTKVPTVMLEKPAFDSHMASTFKPIYPDLEPNMPLGPAIPTPEIQSPGNGTFLVDSLNAPVSQVTHDTMIHIYNPLSPNGTDTISYGPPKKVHILFASNNGSELYKSQLNETFNVDCPTITINTITRVNNTIQGKEGCTDLNIIINSHILNSNIEDDPGGGANDSKVTQFEVFQGTHININSDPPEEPPDEDGADKEIYATQSEVVEEALNATTTQVPTETTAEAETYATTDDNKDELAAEAAEQEPVQEAAETQQAGSVANPATQAVTALTPAAEDAEDDEEDDALDFSPVGIMDYFSSLMARYTYLNPVNYGIFSMAVAPFAAFAAGIIGVATFLFPWAFPGAFDLARSHRYDSGDLMRDLGGWLRGPDRECERVRRGRKKCRRRRRR